jgi:hypothetical protein
MESKEERDRLGNAARRYVEEHCASDKVANLYLRVLQAAQRSERGPHREIPSPWGESYLRERLKEVIP